jgi:hypothetical protein
MATFDPFTEQILGLREQQALAQKLREQGMQAPEGQTVSGVYVAPRNTQYLAQALKTYLGGQDVQQAQQGIKDLMAKREAENAAFLSGMPKTTETQVEVRTPEMMNQMGPSPLSRALRVNPTPDELIAYAAKAPGINPVDVGNLAVRGAELQAGREARIEEAKLKGLERIEAEKIRAEEALKRDKQHMQMLAAMRQPKEAKAPDWKYDAGSDTWVLPPNEQFPMGRTTPNVGKVSALNNLSYLAKKFEGTDETPGLLQTAQQGGWMGVSGAIGRVTNSQEAKAFENATEQMSTELRKIFRIPGEGALSDKEQAQYGIQLPKLGNDPKLNQEILNDLKVRAINSANPAGVNPLQMQGGAMDFGAPPAGAVRRK